MLTGVNTKPSSRGKINPYLFCKYNKLIVEMCQYCVLFLQSIFNRIVKKKLFWTTNVHKKVVSWNCGQTSSKILVTELILRKVASPVTLAVNHFTDIFHKFWMQFSLHLRCSTPLFQNTSQWKYSFHVSRALITLFIKSL